MKYIFNGGDIDNADEDDDEDDDKDVDDDDEDDDDDNDSNERRDDIMIKTEELTQTLYLECSHNNIVLTLALSE